MSQQTAQNILVSQLGEKSHRALDYFRTLPVSFWRGLAVVLTAIWLVHSAASMFWLLFPVPGVEPPPRLAMPVETRIKSNQSVNFDSLLTLKDVFGTSVPVVAQSLADKNKEEVPEEAVTTKLRLKLHGVFATHDPKRGSAIIADGNKQMLYSVGDEIEANRGVKLAGVLDKRVILDNKGNPESLWLFSEEDFKASNISNRSTAPPERAQPKIAPARNTVHTTARPDQIPKSIGDVVRFSVHREGGQMVGYRIRPGRDRELFNQVGLKANDIVTSVNGIEVNDPKQIRSVYKSMKTATEAQLNVLRQGETHSITISLDSQ